MQAPRKRDSKIIAELNANKNPGESKRTRTSMLLAAKIIEGRKAKGWNNIEFAKQMKKKPSVITRWLSGTHNFTSDTLTDIQDVLGISLLALEKEQQKANIPNIRVRLDVNTRRLEKELFPSLQKGKFSDAHVDILLAFAGGTQATKIEVNPVEL